MVLGQTDAAAELVALLFLYLTELTSDSTRLLEILGGDVIGWRDHQTSCTNADDQQL